MFLSSTEGARTIFTSDFVRFNKRFVKPMADAMGEKSVLIAPEKSHIRIRRLLSNPFSMDSLSTFVKKIDKIFGVRLWHEGNNCDKSTTIYHVIDYQLGTTR